MPGQTIVEDLSSDEDLTGVVPFTGGGAKVHPFNPSPSFRTPSPPFSHAESKGIVQLAGPYTSPPFQLNVAIFCGKSCLVTQGTYKLHTKC